MLKVGEEIKAIGNINGFKHGSILEIDDEVIIIDFNGVIIEFDSITGESLDSEYVISVIINNDRFENLQHKIVSEGFHYCFKSYSSWNDIEDKEFHKLRKKYLKAAELLEAYINKKKI